MTSFNTENGSKAVDLASTADSASAVFFLFFEKKNNGDGLIIRLTSMSNLKRICEQLARKMLPRISNATLGKKNEFCTSKIYFRKLNFEIVFFSL